MTKKDRNRGKQEASQFLTGWKEIANYMGKGVRTVQRYEWQMGLPVRRPAAKAQAAVVATKQEIDAWVAASPIRQSFQLIRPAAELPKTTVNALQTGIAKMMELRRQMQELRTEMGMSVDLLRKSVGQLHGSEQWWKSLSQPDIDGSDGSAGEAHEKKGPKLN